jgi:hypothetical protein
VVRQTKSSIIRRKLLCGKVSSVLAISEQNIGFLVDVKYPHRQLRILRAGARTWGSGPAVGTSESARITTRVIVNIPTDPRPAVNKEKEIVRDTNLNMSHLAAEKILI